MKVLFSNKHNIIFKVISSQGGLWFIGMDIFSAELGLNPRVINIHGPCHRQEDFLHRFLNLSITSPDHLVLGGDLNFSLGFGESWGSQAQVDPLSGYMMNLLEQHNLTDVPMNKPLPTWRNIRVGEATLARRLDHLLIKMPLLHQLNRYRHWVASRGILDLSPIYMEILGPHSKPRSPFKFNHMWLHDPEYTKLTTDYQKANPITRHRSLANAV